MPKRPSKPTDRPASQGYRRPRGSQARQSTETRPIVDLMREVPEGLAAYNAILSLLDATPKQTTIHRAAAILGAAFIEYALKAAITKHLRFDLPKRDYEKMIIDIFDDYDRAPLSSFSLKTRMAYALGIINRGALTNFDHLRRIRNHFAHNASEIEFGTTDIEKSIQKLTPPPHSPTERAWSNMPPSNKFAATIHVYYWMLLNYEPGQERPAS